MRIYKWKKVRLVIVGTKATREPAKLRHWRNRTEKENQINNCITKIWDETLMAVYLRNMFIFAFEMLKYSDDWTSEKNISVECNRKHQF